MQKERRTVRMSDPWVRAVKPALARVDYRDTEQRGLSLRVEVSGRKTWSTRYVIAGRSRRFTIGPYPEVSLAVARRKAEEVRGGAHTGTDAQGERSKLRLGETVAEVAGAWVQSEDTRHWRERSREGFEAHLRLRILPRLGRLRLAEVQRGHVQAMLDDVERTTTRNRTFETVRMLFSWAVGRELLSASPCAGITKLHEPTRARVLSDAEIRQVVGAFDATRLGRYVRLLILTGVRRDEALSMRWPDVDRDRAMKMRRGLGREQATRVTRLELGLVSVESVKDRVRDVGWETRVESIWQDVHYALRGLRRAPGFTAVAVLTLAVGIGANTAIFGVIDALMLRELPVRDPDQLVVLTRIQGGQSGESFSYPQVKYLAEQDDLFAGLCGFAADTFHVGPSDALETTAGAWVTGEYYRTLGITPIIGRLLGPDDDRAGAPPAAVITDAYWSRKFARGPDVIGQTLLIEGVPVSIVGVTPDGFSGAIVGNAADITLAVGVVPQVQPEQGWKITPGGRWLKVLARARDGLSREALAAGLPVHWSRYLQSTLNPNLPADARSRALSSTLGFRSGATGSSPLRNEFQRPLLALMAAVGLLLLIACVNMANLLLARAASRDGELTLRSALGASRGRLVRQLMTESAVLALLGAALGLVVASLGSNVLIQLMTAGSTGPDAANAIALEVGPNWRVLTFATLVAVMTTFLFGMAPAWRVTFTTHAAATNVGSPRLVRPEGRVARSLVAAQVAISLPLLIGAGLFAQTLDNLRTLDRGFRHEDVLLIDVDARRTGKDKAALRAFYQQTLAFVDQVPGVRSASLSAVTPLMGGGISMPIAVNGQPVGGEISGEMHFNVIAPRYFEVLGTPFVLGRDFTHRDDATAPPVAIVNEAFVRLYMKDVVPLAQRVSIVGAPADMQVVGVVRDAVYESLRQTPPPTVYAAYLQSGIAVDTATLEMHAPGSLAQVTAAVLREVQPKLAGKRLRARTLTSQLESGLVRERLMTTLAATFGVLALLLAIVGLYGVLAFNVARRTGEIGIRIALGARQSQVLREVLHEAGRMVGLGIAIGLPIAWMASRLVSSMLFGVTAHDPVTSVVSSAVLIGVAFVAALVPGRRAARVDPLAAIRSE